MPIQENSQRSSAINLESTELQRALRVGCLGRHGRLSELRPIAELNSPNQSRERRILADPRPKQTREKPSVPTSSEALCPNIFVVRFDVKMANRLHCRTLLRVLSFQLDHNVLKNRKHLFLLMMLMHPVLGGASSQH